LLAVERLRIKIAADLHDDIGAGLSEINILSAVVAARTPPELKAACDNELNKIGQTARTLIDSMSDIVWLVNPKKDAISDLVSRLSDSFADVFEAKCIRFHCKNSDALQQVRLTMEYRQHLFMIFKEAIHNAVKYSEADRLDLSIQFKGRKLNIRLQDNGKGFDPHAASSGNGLHNMRERAAKIKGALTVDSKKGEGTCVEFSGVLTSR
jgi:signal transduction histidine kinase